MENSQPRGGPGGDPGGHQEGLRPTEDAGSRGVPPVFCTLWGSWAALTTHFSSFLYTSGPPPLVIYRSDSL